MAEALRQWWPAPTVAILIGLVSAFVASTSQSYSAETLMRVGASSTDSTRVTQSAQTAVRLIESDLVFDAAAATTKLETAILRQRAEIVWVSDTEIVSIKVVAPSSEEAKAEVNAIAEATLAATQSIAAAQYNEVRLSADKALQTGVLQDRDAELARKSALGGATAARQDDALASSVLLSRIGGTEAPVIAGISRANLAVLGALSGLLVGIGVALILSGRRGRVRTLDGLRAALSDVEVSDINGLSPLVASTLKIDKPLIVVVGFNGLQDQVSACATKILDELEAEGLRAIRTDANFEETAVIGSQPRHSGRSHLPAMTRIRRAKDLDRLGSDALVVTIDPENSELIRAVSSADLVLIVCKARLTHFQDLNNLRSRIADSDPVVVLI